MFKPCVLKHWTIPSIFVFAALMLVVTLTGAHLAQAGGFNVDSLVNFTPLSATYRTTPNTTGCPAGYAGKFIFTALLTNKPDSHAMPGLDVLVQTLTNGNLLLDPQTNAVLGGQGAVMEIPQVGQYADGLLSADEAVNVPFVVCLKTRQSFQFFVDVFGVVTELVNLNRDGNVINNLLPGGGAFVVTTQLSGISANGRFVLFETAASDLVANDTTGTIDVFVRDLQTETTTLVSVNRFGTNCGNGESHAYRGGPRNTSISADGRFVLFTSWASDLVANDTNGQPDVFVRDLQVGVTTLVSVNRFGTNGGNSGSGLIGTGISADGRFAMFQSWASDLVDVESDTSGNGGIFVRDLQAGTTTLVTVNLNGTGGHGYWPVLSANGRAVAFNSFASDLVANDTNGQDDVFVRDLQTGTTRMATVNWAGTDSGNITGSQESTFALSADGRFVAFESAATDLVPNDTNHPGDVFVRDLQTAITTLVSVSRFGTNGGNHHSFLETISADGRFVLFRSWASDLVANDTNGQEEDIFVRDLQKVTTTLVSVNQFGTGSGNGGSGFAAISADGRFVAFASFSSDLVANDTNDGAGTAYAQLDVFVRDLETEITTLVSVNRTGTDSGNAGYAFGGPALSGDGGVVVFTSDASDLVANDTNGQGDIFVRPVQQ